ncbi:MAG: tyrosine-type recombinase/integrase [Planctomycetota bacterium]|jgi:integrase/recombinase XerD
MLYKRKASKNFYMDLTVQGQRINKSTGTHKKALAIKIQEATREALLLPQVAKGMALRDYLDEVYRYRWSQIPSGDQAYDRMLVICKELGNINVTEIDRPLLRELRERLQDGRSPVTVNRYMANLKTVLSDAYKDDLIDKVPYFDMASEPKVKSINDTLTPEDEHSLFENCEPLLHDILTVALETGMRMGEILQLTPGHIHGQVVRLTPEMTKTNTGRIVPFGLKTQAVIDKCRRNETDLLFPGPSGKMLKSNNVSKMFRKAKIRAALKANFTPHSLRHTFATRKLAAGMTMRNLQMVLGHANLSTTERYAHVAEKDIISAWIVSDKNG